MNRTDEGPGNSAKLRRQAKEILREKGACSLENSRPKKSGRLITNFTCISQ